MARTRCGVYYHFYGVGQGLFFAGEIGLGRLEVPWFRWVYDCGTTSSQDHLAHGLEQLAMHYPLAVNQSWLDLVTLSHFDRDHISGVVGLLDRFRVRTLMLPYVPLWDRLAIAFAEGLDVDDDLLNFFVDPVAYVVRSEHVIERLVLVPPSREPPIEGEASPVFPGGEGPWPLEWDEGDYPADARDVDGHLIENDRTSVSFLQPSGGLRLRGLWEFLPYNDAEFMPKVTHDFVGKVKVLRDHLVRSANSSERKSALELLKDVYDCQFGKSSRKRNALSLFQYCGPIGRSHRVSHGSTTRYQIGKNAGFLDNFPSERLGLLCTGDGYLDTQKRLNALCRYFEPNGQLARTGVLQVMHHGAKANWSPGLADRLKPDVSIFSSDPEHKRYRHPHREVLHDFSSHGPVQVSQHMEWSLTSTLEV